MIALGERYGVETSWLQIIVELGDTDPRVRYSAHRQLK